MFPSGRLSDFENSPEWMDFVKSVVKNGNSWFAKSELGEIKVEFVSWNKISL